MAARILVFSEGTESSVGHFTGFETRRAAQSQWPVPAETEPPFASMN
jgi:hypothetical protein